MRECKFSSFDPYFLKKKMSNNENQSYPKFVMEALMNEMKRMMKEGINQIHEQLDQIESNKWINHKTLLMGIKARKFNQ